MTAPPHDPPPRAVPGVIDAHVHLGLVGIDGWNRGPVVAVTDCGWDPAVARAWRERPPAGLRVRALGPLHTPPGGYPIGHGWAPRTAVRQIDSASAAADAIQDLVDAGFDGAKAVVHAATPWRPGVLEALVAAARSAALPVHVHAEGEGSARRAIEAGVGVLVHTPWSEALADDLIALAAGRTVWVSTFAIHRGDARRIALDNAARFVAAGGRLRYGTDAGNGPHGSGLRLDEVALLARVVGGPDALVEALTADVDGPARELVSAPGPWPASTAEMVHWFARARRVVADGERAR